MSFSSTPGCSAKLEIAQCPGIGQAGEPQPSSESAFLGGVDLDLQQPFERGGQGQVLGAGVVQDPGQGFGGVVKFEVGEVRA